jgi:hypothetical protein
VARASAAHRRPGAHQSAEGSQRAMFDSLNRAPTQREPGLAVATSAAGSGGEPPYFRPATGSPFQPATKSESIGT